MILLLCDIFGQERPVRPAESSQWEGFGFVGLCVDDSLPYCTVWNTLQWLFCTSCCEDVILSRNTSKILVFIPQTCQQRLLVMAVILHPIFLFVVNRLQTNVNIFGNTTLCRALLFFNFEFLFPPISFIKSEIILKCS